jgi:YVTN family beta-propeller protein
LPIFSRLKITAKASMIRNYPNFHKFFLILLTQAVVLAGVNAQTPTNNSKAANVLLPNGWSLSPVGRSLQLGDLPLNIAVSHSKRLIAVTNNGQSDQSIQLIDPVREIILDEVKIPKSWYGLAFSDDDKELYASGGNDNVIVVYHITNKKLKHGYKLTLGKAYPTATILPAGIDVDNKARRLYTVTKGDNALYIFDLKSRNLLKRIALQDEAYACLLSPDRSKLYISSWGGSKVLVYNTKTGNIDTQIDAGEHPNELLTTKSGKYLFVANANDNTVSVINTAADKVIETFYTTLYPTKLAGSTTNGLALSADEKTLYIANADNNCLAVFNVSEPGKSSSKGFIPTGWYPTNVKVVNNKIFVTNGKGFASMANPRGPQPVSKSDNSEYHMGVIGKKDVQYIGGLYKGTMSIINEPAENTLVVYSQQVYQNTPFSNKLEVEAKGIEGNPIPRKLGEKSPIKHVFYVIKENRTYDQIFGDMKEGNGDPRLCLFPEKVTPNHHALARQFVLLDNFYVDAEVSVDGHNWSMAAYATDYVEKSWPTSYGGRGAGVVSRKMSTPRDGFIWDYCQRAGVSYRSYGEFTDGKKATIKALEGRFCEGYPSFNLDIRDVDRIKIFKRDFDALVAAGNVPQLSTIRLPNDHTSGQKLGKISPMAAVADNDYSLGQLVEIISTSPIWKESAIFVLEDDAQNGPDHVDAHRSPAFVISPYVKMGSVDHTMYSTSGMLRTIELILGLPPMSQYDAAAMPFFNCFTSTPDTKPYFGLEAQVDLNTRNTAMNESQRRSEMFNLAKEDAAPDLDLNEVVWKSIKGEDSVMPAPRRSAFLKLEAKRDDDDD